MARPRHQPTPKQEAARARTVLLHLAKLSPPVRRWVLDRLLEMVSHDQEGTEWELRL